MANYIGAIDQGTTSTRFIVFDRSGHVAAIAQKEHEQIYPTAWMGGTQPRRNLAAHTRGDCGSHGSRPASGLATSPPIGITNQRETTVVWNRKTGKPVANALVWQDTRVADYVSEMAKAGGQDRFRSKTGLAAHHVFQRSENPLDSRTRNRCSRTGRGGRRDLRQHRYLSGVEL